MTDEHPPVGTPVAADIAKATAGPERPEEIRHASKKAHAEQKRQHKKQYYQERRAREQIFERMVLGG